MGKQESANLVDRAIRKQAGVKHKGGLIAGFATACEGGSKEAGRSVVQQVTWT